MEDGTSHRRPFNVVVHQPNDDELAPVELPPDDGWSAEDLEAEYLKAVEAAEQAELLSEIAIDAVSNEPNIEAAPDEAVEESSPEEEVDESLSVDTAQVLEALL